jgi:hypothetical protein
MGKDFLRDMTKNYNESPKLEGRFLFDYNRGQRNAKNRLNTREAFIKCRERVANPDRMHVGFFKCPVPREPKRRVEDFNIQGFPELHSVHHYKALICDNDVLILGGN